MVCNLIKSVKRLRRSRVQNNSCSKNPLLGHYPASTPNAIYIALLPTCLCNPYSDVLVFFIFKFWQNRFYSFVPALSNTTVKTHTHILSICVRISLECFKMVTFVKNSTLSTKLLTPIFNSFLVEMFALVSLADIEVKQW